MSAHTELRVQLELERELAASAPLDEQMHELLDQLRAWSSDAPAPPSAAAQRRRMLETIAPRPVRTRRGLAGLLRVRRPLMVAISIALLCAPVGLAATDSPAGRAVRDIGRRAGLPTAWLGSPTVEPASARDRAAPVRGRVREAGSRDAVGMRTRRTPVAPRARANAPSTVLGDDDDARGPAEDSEGGDVTDPGLELEPAKIGGDDPRAVPEGAEPDDDVMPIIEADDANEAHAPTAGVQDEPERDEPRLIDPPEVDDDPHPVEESGV